MARNEPFIINIGIEDHLTAGLTKINKQLAAIQAPTKRLQSQLSKFADATGITKVVNGLTDLGRKAVGAFLSVAQLIPALGALTGVASIAGMGALVKQFADWGNQISRNAALLNTTPGRLTEIENAAQLAGANVGSMTQGMLAFRQALNDTVLNGGATDLGKQFATIGLDWTKMRKEMDDDPTAAFAHYATELQKHFSDIQQRMHEAGVAGFSPDTQRMFTELDQLNARLAQARKNAGPNVDEQAKIAQQLQEQFTNVSQAAQGMAREVTAAISPILTTWLNGITGWLNDPVNRKWISDETKEGLALAERAVKAIKGWIDTTNLGDFRKDWELMARAATAFADAIDRTINITSGVLGIATGLGDVLGKGARGDWAGAKHGADQMRYGAQQLQHGVVPSRVDAPGQIAPNAPAPGFSLPPWMKWLGTPDENAKKTGEQVSQSLDKTWQDSLADSIKNTLHELFAIKAAQGAPGSIELPPIYGQHADAAALSSAEQVARAQQARTAFMAAGYTDQQAVGLVANLVKESGLRAGARGDGGLASGIAQWHSDRVAAILKGTGIDVRTANYTDQLKAVTWELDHNEAEAGRRLRGETSYAGAGGVISEFYERPKHRLTERMERGMAADDWHRRLGDRPLVSVPSAANNNNPATSKIGGTIDTRIVIEAAPGLRARASSSATGANLSPPRTNQVMTGTN